MLRNRYHNALLIQEGACNPSGITHALLSAMQELHAENADTPTICNDPAVSYQSSHQFISLSLHGYELPQRTLELRNTPKGWEES